MHKILVITDGRYNHLGPKLSSQTRPAAVSFDLKQAGAIVKSNRAVEISQTRDQKLIESQLPCDVF